MLTKLDGRRENFRLSSTPTRSRSRAHAFRKPRGHGHPLQKRPVQRKPFVLYFYGGFKKSVGANGKKPALFFDLEIKKQRQNLNSRCCPKTLFVGNP
ncbi:hypothetical protein RRG08_036716 [Elysia crispata]|uniref:Uncharacterized protein n=1 Tax=Elysia crispata TaxID=231223 RepID=A0AAE0XVM6_9GAST|nr:hypothetical protein RRG08_036716 [Elysia crispata]